MRSLNTMQSVFVSCHVSLSRVHHSHVVRKLDDHVGEMERIVMSEKT